MYFCYDIRGIQSFVFQIPRLRYIIGGSALIDRFDRKTVPDLAAANGWTRISSGGGKGAFSCDSRQADAIQEALLREVAKFGADIRFGRHEDYSEAAQCADRLFPYLPKNLDGHPCPESGLYPVSGNEVHEVVNARNWSRGDRLGRWFEERLLAADGIRLAPGLLPADELAFMRDVEEGTPGHFAIGGHNRWAVICMDGNDMGRQFRAQRGAGEAGRMTDWVRAMSMALDACSQDACLAGIERVAREWAGEESVGAAIRDRRRLFDGEALVLPVRPLVVGGDDITVLCHAGYAATFVQEACRVFEETSRKHAREAQKNGLTLWPATGNHITISAGILYCSTSLPLATAIPYAEKLLAMAKRKGRERKDGQEVLPSPACVDFEAVTESLLDDPQTRRARELVFADGDLEGECVTLTRRPYRVDEFGDVLRKLETFNVPGSILHQLLPSLRAGYHDRRVFRWRLGKHQQALATLLAEDEDVRGQFPSGSSWEHARSERDGLTRSTDLIDLALLAQESRRLSREVAP